MDRVAGALPARALLVNSTMTRAAQARIERGVPHVRRHVRILTLGTEERERSPARVSGRPLRVGMVCRFQAWKGIDLFLEAAVFARKAGADLVVTLWGGPTDAPDSRAYAEGLPARAEAAGVHLAGPVRDFRELRGCIDVIVNASLTPEPFGLTLIEGMSIGAVPVAPREGGPCEIIEEDRTGLFFAPRDARALGEVLTALAADPGYVARLSGDAWESARTRFSAGRMVRELETLYTELLSR